MMIFEYAKASCSLPEVSKTGNCQIPDRWIIVLYTQRMQSAS